MQLACNWRVNAASQGACGLASCGGGACIREMSSNAIQMVTLKPKPRIPRRVERNTVALVVEHAERRRERRGIHVCCNPERVRRTDAVNDDDEILVRRNGARALRKRDVVDKGLGKVAVGRVLNWRQRRSTHVPISIRRRVWGGSTATVTSQSHHSHSTVTAQSPHFHSIVTAQSQHSHRTVTAQSPHSHRTVTAQSPHSHRLVTEQSPHRTVTAPHSHRTFIAQSQSPHSHSTVTAHS